MSRVVSLQEISIIIKKRIKLILIIVVFGSALSIIMVYLRVPTYYISSAQMIVKLPTSNDAIRSSNMDDINFNIMLINTYRDLVTKSDVIATKVHQQLAEQNKFQGSVSDLKSSLSVVQESNSQMFSINAKSLNSETAKQISKTVAYTFKEEVQALMGIDKVAIITESTSYVEPNSPKLLFSLLIGGIVSGFIGINGVLLQWFWTQEPAKNLTH